MSRSSYNRPNSSLRSTIHGQSSPSDSDQELVEHSVVKRAHASAKDRLATHNSKRAARKASRSAPTHSPSHLPPTEHDEHKFPPPSSSSEHEHDADHGGEKRSMWGGRRYGTHTKDLELGPEEPLSEEEEEKHHLVHGEQEWHGEHRHPPSRWKRMPKKEKLEVVVTGAIVLGLFGWLVWYIYRTSTGQSVV
ncbi:hypothetical protein JCM8097_002708 [Rhodosporidiobolus ruineniae]